MRNCEYGVRYIDEATTGSWSWGHDVSDIYIDGARVAMFGSVNDGGPRSGTRDLHPTYFSNIKAVNTTGIFGFFKNSTMVFSNVDVQFASTVGDTGGRAFYADNCSISASDINMDYRQSAGATTEIFRFMSSTSDVTRYRVQFTSTTAPTLGRLAYTDSGNIRLSDGILSGPLTSQVSSGSRISWRVGNIGTGLTARNGQRPGLVSLTQGETATYSQKAANAFADDQAPAIRLLVGPITSATNLFNLPVGRSDGQFLILKVAAGSTASAFTVQHGATPRTELRGSTNISMSASQEMVLYWDGELGLWVQTSAV